MATLSRLRKMQGEIEEESKTATGQRLYGLKYRGWKIGKAIKALKKKRAR